jgi:hypothetical protein
LDVISLGSSFSPLHFVHDARSHTSHLTSSVADPCDVDEPCGPHPSSSAAFEYQALAPSKNAAASSSNMQCPKHGRPPKVSLPTARRHIGRPRGSGPKQKAKAKAELLGNTSPPKKRSVGRPRKADSGGGKVTVRILTEKIVFIFQIFFFRIISKKVTHFGSPSRVALALRDHLLHLSSMRHLQYFKSLRHHSAATI